LEPSFCFCWNSKTACSVQPLGIHFEFAEVLSVPWKNLEPGLQRIWCFCNKLHVLLVLVWVSVIRQHRRVCAPILLRSSPTKFLRWYGCDIDSMCHVSFLLYLEVCQMDNIFIVFYHSQLLSCAAGVSFWTVAGISDVRTRMWSFVFGFSFLPGRVFLQLRCDEMCR
jgi:hypothetical protein